MPEPTSAPPPGRPAPRDAFAPARLGPLTLRNRIVKAATFEGRTPEALVSDELVAFHREVAAGGVALTTVAYCAVAPEGRTERRQIHMRPEALPGLRRLAAAVHEEGAAASAQIGHAGPVADARSNRAEAVAASRRRSPLTGLAARAATEADIARIVTGHADAAEMAAEAGFDAVECHFGHGYFVSSFLSPKSNRRQDEWGGTLENRARLARLVARTVRERVGRRIAVTAKLNMEDGVRGGFSVEESVRVARMLQDDGHLDALELTAGSSLANPMYLFHGDAPVREFATAFPQPLRLGIRVFGRLFLRTYPYEDCYLLPQARRFRAALDMPLILLGGITGNAALGTAMDEGFEFAAMGRALLMEPALVSRMRDAQLASHQAESPGAEARSACIHCNKCMPTIYSRSRCVVVDPIA
ncbi:NADH:flavin oxidoreductase [Streptomyces iconiensis]|uniref:NADH:flavin oxidoreductase n=1 Tax=Streptomyces iconiensis TaxID=1384038 RepID=A0ABT7A727_9ACTN|nr:NADH:flavin oxidoreductase [Streptomyces iconiensis]MDJ1137137.1 NADH:flavin oxidoreductase [Streptomyces iconiensis]